MRVVVTVHKDKTADVFEKLVLEVKDEGYIEQAAQDIKDFLGEQYFEMSEDGI